MEYLEGYDLAQLVERSGPLPAEEAVEYVMQACEAIAAAHALGIVHRDLKPANLFLTSSTDGMPCIKVLDFGISKLSESASGTTPGLTSTTTVMGTPCYMSPEQLRSTRDVDGRADIWSLGAILHALMTGTPPYDGESNADVSAKIIRDAPTPLRELCPDATPELEAAVLRCLEKDPAKRFPDVVSLADALSQVTPRSSSKAAATRVARIAAAVAPTILSVPPPAQLPPAAVGGATPGPTRTASAWGDTRSEEKRGRKIAGVVAAAGIAAGVLVFGVLRWQGTSAPTVAAPPPPASIATAVPATASAVVVVPPPSVTASATVEVVASSPPAVKVPVSRGGAVRPAPTADTKARTAPKPTSTANLFEGRE
jgi:serine/threonine-protein kinase